MTPREALTAALEPLVPPTWTVITSQRTSDSRGTALHMTQQKVRRHRAAGTGVHEIDFTVDLVVAGEDVERVEDELDDELTVFSQALDDAGIYWDEWVKGEYPTGLGYRATITITAEKEL